MFFNYIMEIIPLRIPIQGLFLMILIVSANFLAETFPCRIQHLLKHNMYAKHFFGFLTMIFFVVESLPNVPDSLGEIAEQSVILYFLFILMTQTHAFVFLFLMVVLGFTHLIYLRKNEIIKQMETYEKIPEGKGKLLHKYNDLKSKEELLTFVTKLLYIFIVATLIFGVILYMGSKKLEYKNKFRYDYFILGKPTCSASSPKNDFLKMLRYSFT